ncbi:MAG: right-handed parallel beta-helix repeat-containing protein [Thermomicrobiales bacterium]
MDARRFDALTRLISIRDSRRTVLGFLAALPLLSRLPGWLSPEEAAAKDRRRRRKGRQKKRRNKAKGKRQRQRNRHACKPKGKAVVCAGTCGAVKSRQTCGKTVDCGSCACDPPCAVCFTCQAGPNTPGTCVPDPDQAGAPCGSPGQVCASDGTCACSANSCPACEECGDDGACAGCSGCCDGETCVAACPACTLCDDKQCVPCPGCCDGSGVCQDGDTNAACGKDGGVCEVCTAPETCGGGDEAGMCGCTPTTCAAEGKNCGQFSDGCGTMLDCGSCSNPTPVCASNICTACTTHAECGQDAICADGSCLACDITCGTTDHTCDAAALETALAGGGAVVVCPGLYTGRISVKNVASVTMLGGGQGDDPTSSTVLRYLEVTNVAAFAMSHVRIQGFARTNCVADNGIYIEDSGATLTDCAIADIGPKFCTAFSTLRDSIVEMVDCLVTGSYLYGSGGLHISGGRLTLRRSSIKSNYTLDNGGGLSATDGALVEILDGTAITENRAEGGGGGINVGGGAEVRLHGSTVTGNQARKGADEGGGIYVGQTTDTPPVLGKAIISADSSVTGNVIFDVSDPNHTEPNNCAGPGTIDGICGP